MKGKSTRTITAYGTTLQEDQLTVLAAAAGKSKSAFLIEIIEQQYAEKFGVADPRTMLAQA